MKLSARGPHLAGVLVAALVGLLVATSDVAGQQVSIWNGGTSTNWSTAANWGGVLPNPISNVTIDTNSGNRPVLSTGTIGVPNITVGNTTSSGANTLLTIEGGAHLTVNTFFLVGNQTGSSGSVLVKDTGTVLTTNESTNPPPSGSAIVGDHGTGNLTIANGAIVNGLGLVGDVTGSNGTVLVTDPGTEWLPGMFLGAGVNGTCNITVANGANLTTTIEGFIGDKANSNGSVTITDSGSVWNATGNIAVGNGTNSSGNLTLANGGVINMTSGNIFLGGAGNGTLNLNSGAFFQDGNANGSLIFPFNNSGNATINWNGGTMQVTKNIAFTPNMTMTGNGCIFDTNGFNCTFSGNLSGTGNLTKNGNGNLSLTLSVNGAGTSFYTGNTTVNAGTLSIALSSFIPANLSTNITDNATLIIGQQSRQINYVGILSGNGTVSVQSNVTMNGTSTFTGNLQIGTVPPPEFTEGILILNGDTSQMGGNLTLEAGTLNFTQNFDASYAGNITVFGGLATFFYKSGSGNLTLSGQILAFSPSFPIQVFSGNMILTGNTAQIQGVYFISGTNLIFNQAFDSSLQDPEGSGNLIQEGTGTLTIFNPIYTGITTIKTGTLVFAESEFLLTGNIANNSALAFSSLYDDACPAAISGTGTVAINAGGNLTLTGTHTYTGATTINSGTLLVDGQLAAASNVAVKSGAALGGNGTVLGPVTVNAGGGLNPGDNGSLTPGNYGNLTYVGTLSVNSLSLDPAATTTFSLTNPGNYSNLSVTGSLAEAGNMVINLSSGFQPGTYQLITSTGGLSNDFGNVTVAGLYSTALTDSGGVWTGSTSGVNFSFNAITGQLVTNYTIVPLNPSGTTTFSITDSGNFTNLPVAGTLAEAGNVVLNLSSNLHAGTYQLITSNGGTSNDFGNVTLAGLYTGALTDCGGVWSGTISGATFTFNAATGQLVISTPLPSGISASKTTWLQQYFTVPQLLDSTISGDNASPSGDGISNYLKYALNLNPWVDGHMGLPQPAVANGYLELIFTAYQSDVIYNVEASTDLATWSTDGVVINPNDNLQDTAIYPLPPSGTAFLRLVVTPSD